MNDKETNGYNKRIRQNKLNKLYNRKDISSIIELPARIPPTVIKITKGFYNKENIISKTAKKIYNDIYPESKKNKSI